MIAFCSLSGINLFHKKNVGTITYLLLRYRQTPTVTNKNSPRLRRERCTYFLLTA